jgi:subtilase family serine protease
LPLCDGGGVTSCGLFTKVDQTGGSSFPAGNVGWGQEIALDLDMASAVCPECAIVLVEGNSSSLSDLGAAVTTAAGRAGVVAISNSYGTSREYYTTSAAAPYNQPGKAVTVSSGDSGYGISFPDNLSTIVAVGGTSLTFSGGLPSEKAWSKAGSGCSAYVSKPTFQVGVVSSSICKNRASADISAVADPAHGVAVYDSYGSTGDANWYVFGGTSVSAPIIAGMFALAAWSPAGPDAMTTLYTNRASLTDITSGANGRCKVTALCTSVAGWDGPTGLGVPRSTAAFKNY